MWPVKGFDKYRIYYRPRGDTIEILRILHAARDLEKFASGFAVAAKNFISRRKNVRQAASLSRL
ncbi:MAG: type II toxin-antitoxin system RelE/ParE family toxin, partial [Blastocatellia bacterium]